MIAVDSSALIAILLDEPEKQEFEDIIAGGERCIMSAVNVHETACVLRSRLTEQAYDATGRPNAMAGTIRAGALRCRSAPRGRNR